MKKFLMLGLTTMLLVACSAETDEKKETLVDKETVVDKEVSPTSKTVGTILSKEDIGFYNATELGNAVIKVDSKESLDLLWNNYTIKEDKPSFNNGNDYYIVTFGHGGCTQEVDSFSIEEGTIAVELTEVKEMVCTMQYIARSTIVEIESAPVETVVFEGLKVEILNLSDVLSQSNKNMDVEEETETSTSN